MTLRIRLGRLALMPDATTDDALDFADMVAEQFPKADVVVVLNATGHQVYDAPADEVARVREYIDTMAGLWRSGAERMASERPTLPSPPPEGCYV